jgi:hypothetical protein
MTASQSSQSSQFSGSSVEDEPLSELPESSLILNVSAIRVPISQTAFNSGAIGGCGRRPPLTSEVEFDDIAQA